jgi:hypothetical protein
MRSALTTSVVALAIIFVAAPAIGDDAREIARRYIDAHADELGLTERQLTIGSGKLHSHLSQRFVSFEVLRNGLPIFYSRVVVQIDSDRTVRRATPYLSPARAVGPDHQPGSLPAALKRVTLLGLEPLAPRAGWLVARDGTLTAVIRVETGADATDEPLALFLCARTMKIVHAEPLVDQIEAPGAVYSENPVTTPISTIVALSHLDEQRELWLRGRYARVTRCADVLACKETEIGARPDYRGQFLFGPDLTPYSFDDPFAEVNAYYHITAISRWMHDEFGWNADFGGNTWISVWVGLAIYNAYFYQGNDEVLPRIVFGQDTVDFAYDADVAFHEFGHAINRSAWSHPWFFADELGMDTSPFGIEEGLADIWAETFAGDPVMNAYIVYSRTADNNLICPDDLRAEGHMEARIVSGFGWDVRERIGADAWNHIVFRSLLILESEAGFDNMVAALTTSAEQLLDEGQIPIPNDTTEVILEEAHARGLTDPDCLDRLVPLPEGRHKIVYGYGRDRTWGHDFPFGLQWRIVAPADAAAFRVTFDCRHPDDRSRGFRAHVSRGRPVQVTWYPVADLEDGQPAFSVDADLTVSGAPPFIEFPFIGQQPLEPGEEIFVLLSADTDSRIIAIAARPYALTTLPLPPVPPADRGALLDRLSASSGDSSCIAGARRTGQRPGNGLLAAIWGLLD